MEKRTKTLLLIFISLVIIAVVFFLDNYFLKAIPLLRLSFLNPLFIFLGSLWGAITYLLILTLLFLYEKKKKFIPCLITTFLLAFALAYFLKYLIMRPRPEIIPLKIIPLIIKSSPSFPSAHALLSSSAFFFVRKIKFAQPLIFIFAFLIAFSGFYNGVHYLSDILAGIFFGLILSYLTFNKMPELF